LEEIERFPDGYVAYAEMPGNVVDDQTLSGLQLASHDGRTQGGVYQLGLGLVGLPIWFDPLNHGIVPFCAMRVFHLPEGNL
jgi:hypothetical protein